jgi:hypothetical protein
MPLRSPARKLARLSDRLKAAREELEAASAQVVFFEEEASDAGVRGIVSENPYEQRAAEEARRTADNARRHRERVAVEVARLQQEADELLDLIGREGA